MRHYHAYYAVKADAQGCVEYRRIDTAHRHRNSARRVAEKALRDVNARLPSEYRLWYSDGVITRACSRGECAIK